MRDINEKSSLDSEGNFWTIRRSSEKGRIIQRMVNGRSKPREAFQTRPTYTWTFRTSTTAPILEPSANETEQYICVLFDRARYEIFEAGVETDFSRDLMANILRYSIGAVELIAHLILHKIAGVEPAAEALRCIGYIDHPPTYIFRRWLLERCIANDSARIRDGALIGLAHLDDPHAIPYIEEAAVRERRVGLRKDMHELLKQLKQTRECHSSSGQ